MSFKNLGTYYFKEQDKLVAMLSNGSYAYLCKSDPETISWSYVEATPTKFTSTSAVEFVSHNGYLIFVNGDTKTISSKKGGVFAWDGSSTSIVLYGVANNPTGEHIELHSERLWVGNLSELEGVAVADAGSWCAVSKIFPEAADTAIDETDFATLLITLGDRTKIEDSHGTPTVDLSGFSVGDVVYIAGCDKDTGIEVLNGNFYEIKEKATTYIVIDADTSKSGLTTPTTIDVNLRGNTWEPSTTDYDDALVGAGIFRCDNNASDEILALRSAFGNLVILREVNNYLFTGALESGDFTLARAINVPYGTLTSSTTKSSSGLWFSTKNGLGKLEGTTVITAKTEFDNLVDITTSYPIQVSYDAINDKSNIEMHLVGREVWIVDTDTNIVWAFDTFNGDWHKRTFRLTDNMIDVDEEYYSMYKHLVFKLEDDYQYFNETNYSFSDLPSTWRGSFKDAGMPINSKDYKMLYALIEGSATDKEQLILTFNLYYDGERTIGEAVSFDIKTATVNTWATALQYSNNVPAQTWDTITSSGTLTWQEILGGTDDNMVENREYYLGTAKNFQPEIVHTDNSSFKVSRFYMDYDPLEIDTLQ